jgi:hypothetical protein
MDFEDDTLVTTTRSPAEERLARRAAERAVRKAAIRRRRLVALAVLVALVVIFVLALRAAACGGSDFTGTWTTGNTLLGSKVWKISKVSGSVYKVTGIEVGSTPVTTLKLQGGKLVASGSVNGAAWSIELTLLGDNNHISARFKASDKTTHIIRLTRSPAN